MYMYERTCSRPVLRKYVPVHVFSITLRCPVQHTNLWFRNNKEEPKPPRRLQTEDGRVLNVNEAK